MDAHEIGKIMSKSKNGLLNQKDNNRLKFLRYIL